MDDRERDVHPLIRTLGALGASLIARGGVLAGLVLAPAAAVAQDAPLPSDQQVAFLTRIPAFDRNFRDRVGEEVVVGVLHQEAFRASASALRSLMAEVEEQGVTSLLDIPTRFVALQYNGGQTLARDIREKGIDLIYVTPLRGVNVKAVVEICREQQIATYTGVPDYAEEGVSVAIGARAGKPEVVVNLPASRAAGVDFSSRFLRMVRVIQ